MRKSWRIRPKIQRVRKHNRTSTKACPTGRAPPAKPYILVFPFSPVNAASGVGESAGQFPDAQVRVTVGGRAPHSLILGFDR